MKCLSLMIWKNLRGNQRKGLENDKEKIVSICLSKLKKAGWLDIVRLDSNNSRKRYYKLNKLEEIYSNMLKQYFSKWLKTSSNFKIH